MVVNCIICFALKKYYLCEIMKINAFLILFLLLTTDVLSVKGNTLLNRLDSVIEVKYNFESGRRETITSLRKELESAQDNNDRYNILRGLYEAYRSYRVDSALIVANSRLEIARKLDKPSKIASATLNVAEAYAKAGAPDKAINILDTLRQDGLEDYHLKYLNAVYRSAYELKSSTSLMPSDRISAMDKLRTLREEAIKYSNPETRGFYSLRAERLRDAGLVDEAVAIMEDADSKFGFEDDAAMQYTMGEIYLSAGRRQDAIDCLTRSAILDLTSGTKEYKSLILLASLLYQEGQVERAFDYINRAFEDVEFSKANIRTAEIMKIMPVIAQAYHNAEQEIAHRTRNFLFFTGAFAIVLLILLFKMLQMYRKNRRMLSVIEKFNFELEQKNNLLSHADKLKLSHIKALMLAYAKHIQRLRDFRKKVYRLLQTSQYDKAMDAVKWNKAEAGDIAIFHEMFDEAFLSMYPDFVKQVNKMMKEPINLNEPGRLTPELRVVAMIRLGMGSTEEIADMFHYSPQTVYNLRYTIRNMISVPWSDFEIYLKTI